MVFGMALMAPMPVLADDDAGTLYNSLRAIGAFARPGGVNATGITGVPRLDSDGGPRLDSNGDPRLDSNGGEVAGVAGVLGYSFGRFPVRAEVEVTHHFDFDAPDQTAQTANYETNLTSTSALASAIVEWRNDTGLTPYAGVTAGWARTAADSGRLDLSLSDTAENGEATDNFAFGGILGLDLGLGKNLSAGVAYRYLNLGNGDSGSIDAADSISTDDYVSHDVLLSILYRF